MKTGALFLTNGNALGKRLISYEFYDEVSKGFVGMSEKQIKDGLKAKMDIRGFVLKGDELVLDEEGMGYTNIQMKSGVNSLSWKNSCVTSEINTAVIVVGKRIVAGKTYFETVNAKHARVEYEESKLSVLMQVMDVYGVREKNGNIEMCKSTDDVKEKAVEKKPVKNTETVKKPENSELKSEVKKETDK